MKQEEFDKIHDLKGYLLRHPDQKMVDNSCRHYLGNSSIEANLIGKKFKRISVHGLSIGTGIITRLFITYEVMTNPFRYEIPVIKVESENGVVYDLFEIRLI